MEVRLAGTGVGSAPADALGRWTVAYAGPALPPGPHAFTAVATDLAGNASAPSAAVVVDTAVATPAILAILDDTGASISDGVTSDNRLILTGTAGAGDAVTVSRAGSGIVGTTTADGAGTWSLDYTATPLADGTHAFRAAATRGGGHEPALARLRGPRRHGGPARALGPALQPYRAHQQRRQHHLPGHLRRDRGRRRRRPTSLPSSAAASPVRCPRCRQPRGPSSTSPSTPSRAKGTVRLDVNAAGTGIADAAGNALGGRLHRRPGLHAPARGQRHLAA